MSAWELPIAILQDRVTGTTGGPSDCPSSRRRTEEDPIPHDGDHYYYYYDDYEETKSNRTEEDSIPHDGDHYYYYYDEHEEPRQTRRRLSTLETTNGIQHGTPECPAQSVLCGAGFPWSCGFGLFSPFTATNTSTSTSGGESGDLKKIEFTKPQMEEDTWFASAEDITKRNVHYDRPTSDMVDVITLGSIVNGLPENDQKRAAGLVRGLPERAVRRAQHDRVPGDEEHGSIRFRVLPVLHVRAAGDGPHGRRAARRARSDGRVRQFRDRRAGAPPAREPGRDDDAARAL